MSAPVKLTAAQRRAALLRVSQAEAFRARTTRRLTPEEVANYYGAGKRIPIEWWAVLEAEGLITRAPLALTDAGHAALKGSKP